MSCRLASLSKEQRYPRRLPCPSHIPRQALGHKGLGRSHQLHRTGRQAGQDLEKMEACEWQEEADGEGTRENVETGKGGRPEGEGGRGMCQQEARGYADGVEEGG